MILFLSGCTKDGFKSIQPGQQIYFQVEGLNYAWGIYHAGIFIDSVGNRAIIQVEIRPLPVIRITKTLGPTGVYVITWAIP